MEATLGISLYTVSHLLFNKIGEQEGRTGSAWKEGSRGIGKVA
jgi:hypothetical protein